MDLLKLVRTAASTETWFTLEDTIFCSLLRWWNFPDYLSFEPGDGLSSSIFAISTPRPLLPYLTSNRNHDFEFPHQTGPATATAPCSFLWNLGSLSPCATLIPWRFYLMLFTISGSLSNSWWSHHSRGWFFHCLYGLLVSGPPPAFSTLLHTSHLLYNNKVLLIIVTVTPSIISGTYSLIITCHISNSRLLVQTVLTYLTGTYNPLTLWPFHCSSPHSPFSIQFKLCGQP